MSIAPDPKIWDGILAHLKQHHAPRCRRWFENIEMAGLAGGVLTLRVNQPLHLRYLQQECTEVFREAAQSATGRLLSVIFVSAEEAAGLPTLAAAPQTPTAPSLAARADTGAAGRDGSTALAAASPAFRPAAERTGVQPSRDNFYSEMVINPDYSFETFIVGPNNQLAHAAALAVAQQPGVPYNPFFIHSPVGLGKTHLLQAICQAVIAGRPDCRIYYVSCDGFMNQFMEAVQAGQMHNFRHKFRDIDILVVDDIHCLAGHERTQEEFFHTFNSLYQSEKQIVLSSDTAPNDIPKLEDRLLSRFKHGLVARMDKPCYETRLAILRIKAQLRGLTLGDDVLCFVAHHTDSNIRELEGALTRLQAAAMALNRPIDAELAHEALTDGLAPITPIVSIQSIIATVARHFEVKQTDLLSEDRHKSVTFPRQVAMYLARCHSTHSLQEIGGFFGGRDHTTVMYAERKIANLRATEPAIDRRLDMIERDLSIRLA